jgi:hypothetical protein
LLIVARVQQPNDMRSATVVSGIEKPLRYSDLNTPIWTKVVMMSRLTTLRITTDGRLLGFDTGDWSMLLGGFVLAGLLALLV